MVNRKREEVPRRSGITYGTPHDDSQGTSGKLHQILRQAFVLGEGEPQGIALPRKETANGTQLKGEYEHDKICAYQTLYECLETLSKLMAPIAPFFADWLFNNINK